MGWFIGQLAGFIVGAGIGLFVTGSFICDPFLVALDGAAQRLSDIDPEAAMQVLLGGGGNLVYRCAVVDWSLEPIAGWSFSLGRANFQNLILGVPLLFGCLGWLLVRCILRKATH